MAVRRRLDGGLWNFKTDTKDFFEQNSPRLGLKYLNNFE